MARQREASPRWRDIIVVVLVIWDDEAENNEECRRMEDGKFEGTLGFVKPQAARQEHGRIPRWPISETPQALSATLVLLLPNQKNGTPGVERETLLSGGGVEGWGGVAWLLQRKLFFFCWQSSPLASQNCSSPSSSHSTSPKIIPSLFRIPPVAHLFSSSAARSSHLHSIRNLLW